MTKPPSKILIAYEGQILEYDTHSPGRVRAEDICDYYSEFAFNKPLELWHKGKRMSDDRLVGQLKGLLMMPAAIPAHHQLCSPGKSPQITSYLTPREVYELGMRSQPSWHGELPVYCVCNCNRLRTQTEHLITLPLLFSKLHLHSLQHADKLEVFLREDGERGVKALENFRSGSFMLEFEGNLLTQQECEAAEQEYEREGKPVYILEVHLHKGY